MTIKDLVNSAREELTNLYEKYETERKAAGPRPIKSLTESWELMASGQFITAPKPKIPWFRYNDDSGTVTGSPKKGVRP